MGLLMTGAAEDVLKVVGREGLKAKSKKIWKCGEG